MRVLVAGRNAKVLATAAGTFSHDLTIETASTKAACIALLERIDFDLIVACETLGDGSGLEVLSHAAVNTPNALRIFAARPSTLQILKGELGLFGLFRTLPYPIDFRKLWAAINLARSCCAETELGPKTHAQSQARTPGVQHVVLESGWQTGEPAGEVRQQRATTVQRLAVAARAAATANSGAVHSASRGAVAASGSARGNASVATHVAAPSRQAQDPRGPAQARTAQASFALPRPGQARTNTTPQRAANTAMASAHTRGPATANGSKVRSASRGAAAASGGASPARTTPAIHALPRKRQAAPGTASPRNTRIPESDAFKRALAKRNAAKLDVNTHISAMEVLGAARPASPQGDRRREPAMSNDSLAQLARMATTRRPLYESRGVTGGKKRAAIFVGSGVFAAATAAVLTFFMLNANNSIGHTSLPLVRSVQRPTPQKVFAWEAAAPEPASPSPPPVSSEAAAAAADDLELQAEADSDASAVEPGHPGPPQPNAPPGPSEPPTADSPGWVDE